MQKPGEKYRKFNELILCRIDGREEENMNYFLKEFFDLYFLYKVKRWKVEGEKWWSRVVMLLLVTLTEWINRVYI